MKKVSIVILICSGVVEHIKAFEDKEEAESHAYDISTKYAKRWFGDAYLKDWDDVFNYQQQLKDESVEVLVVSADYTYDNRSGLWNKFVSWTEKFFKKENV